MLNLGSIKNYKIIEKNIYSKDAFFNLDYKFDIIFLDPPFKDNNLNNLFNKIKDHKLLKEGGIIILHRHKNEIHQDITNFELIEEKVYGISKIRFLTNLH